MISIAKSPQRPLRDLVQQLPQKYRQEFLRGVTRDIVPAVNAALVRDLAENTPPARTPSSPTFVWSRNKAANARARRWWFANIKKGNIRTDGHNYIRSGKLQQAWTIRAIVQQGKATITVENPSRGASYVYGDENRAQIPGHATTGWPSVNRQVAAKRKRLDTAIEKAADSILERAVE